jgi:hypothetical protein
MALYSDFPWREKFQAACWLWNSVSRLLSVVSFSSALKGNPVRDGRGFGARSPKIIQRREAAHYARFDGQGKLKISAAFRFNEKSRAVSFPYRLARLRATYRIS